ncbi:helix-turn-helix transcriptional regulator [Aeromonas veronii]|uniref:helix-turn-helix transcriptional regulator n=1 Tax=Aeromonas TaxID=642 RepID=UPI0022DF2A78|nr:MULTISPECIES: helix-turn-helix domain-containing protein [Aeromonas]MDX7650026.1 helix-turn-helix domain-containing protein [Aeromonas caviae]HDX8361654.1 helix-turn-helix domain-containing protein [Aeromonas veronii]HEA3202010.1 helix-turn-helix domain-containing protein [Aeromonas veronii]
MIKMMTEKQICEMLQVCRATLWAWRKGGKFPAPVKMGSLNRWRVSDVEGFINGQQ